MSSDPAKLAAQGSEALSKQDYETAISKYTSALAILPTAVDYYIKRSTAYQRSAQLQQAFSDAEIAVSLSYQRSKRELMGQAQLRRGISCYQLGRYGDAGFCFRLAKQLLGSTERSVGMWVSKLELVLDDKEKVPDDDVRREVTIKEVPDVSIPTVTHETSTKKEENIATPSPLPQQPLVVTTPRDKIRHEWYQTATHVVFTLYVKGVSKDTTSIEIEDDSIAISFPLPSSSDFQYTLDPLFSRIDPHTSTFSILSTKIELKLTKRSPGEKWKTLEGTIPTAAEKGKDKEETSPSQAPAAPNSTSSTSTAPAYPTSSKSGPKNWDKLAGDAGEDEEEGDPVNFFFKNLYKDADPDTRRAMMKSYVESNGTALSTNWEQVKQGKVETSPPEGMTAKKWDET